MRLFLLPISTRRALIYCAPGTRTTPVAQQSYVDRIVNKANETWLGWEKDSKAPLNWKQRTTTYGNKLFARIPFEEWGLKTVPPLKKAVSEPTSSRTGTPVSGTNERNVEVSFPGLYQGLCTQNVQETLRRIATDRQSLHRSRMWWSLVGMPISAPVALLPVIPNLPFFYLLFRFYSHWKALRGGQHLEHLMKNESVIMKPSSTLDTLYTAGLLHPTRNASRGAAEPSVDQSRAVVKQLSKQTIPEIVSQAASAASKKSASSKDTPSSAQSSEKDEEVMLLRRWNGKLIAERLGLPGLEVEIERAVEQVEKSIGKSKEEMQQEKQEIEELAQRAESTATQARNQGK